SRRHRRPRAGALQLHRAQSARPADLRLRRRDPGPDPGGPDHRPAALPFPRGPMSTISARTADPTAETPQTTAPLAALLDQFASAGDLTAVRTLMDEGAETGEGGSVVAPTALFPLAAADITRQASAASPRVAISPSPRAAADGRAVLSASAGTDPLAAPPAWQTLPRARLSPRADTVARRLSTLRRIAHPD